MDLNEVNNVNPIDQSDDLVYQEKDRANGKAFGQFKDGKFEGICRVIFGRCNNKLIFEG